MCEYIMYTNTSNYLYIILYMFTESQWISTDCCIECNKTRYASIEDVLLVPRWFIERFIYTQKSAMTISQKSTIK